MENRTKYSRFSETKNSDSKKVGQPAQNTEVDVAEELVVPEATIEEVAAEPEEKKIYGKVNCERLNMRKLPSPSSLVIKILKKGEQVLIDAENSTTNFYHIYTVSSEVGYCVKSFIDIE